MYIYKYIYIYESINAVDDYTNIYLRHQILRKYIKYIFENIIRHPMI